MACVRCGKPKQRQAQKYCSRECYWAHRKERGVYLGEGNPRWCDAAARTCEACGERYDSYQKERKYCSHPCYQRARKAACDTRDEAIRPLTRVLRSRRQLRGEVASRRAAAAKLLKKIRRPRHVVSCRGCGVEFQASPSRGRKYCSYPCFVKSGGIKRAGHAAVRAMKKYGAKKDANHADIQGALEENGVKTVDTSAFGYGFPDMLGLLDGEIVFVEVKNPKTRYGQRGLNKSQEKFIRKCGGAVYILRSTEDAVAMAQGDLKPTTVSDQ